MTGRRRFAVNINVQGLGQRPGAWRTPEADPVALFGPEHWLTIARTAERGVVDALFFADSPSLPDPRVRALFVFEPLVLLAGIAAATEHIGLVGTASTSFNDPVDLARQFAALDRLSGGRAAWNVVTSHSADSARNFGADDMPGRAERYARAEAFVDTVRALWRGETVEHAGEQVRLEHPASPVLIQAGGSPAGLELAARIAEAVYSVELVHQRAVENAAALRAAAARHGRRLSVLPGLSLVIGSTEREARERFDALEALGPADTTINALSYNLGVDVSGLALDEPIPDAILDAPPDADTLAASLAYRDAIVASLRGSPRTLREVLRGFGGYGQRIIVGTPEQIADSLQHWHRSGAADGVNVMLDSFPDGLETFVDQVMPELRARGLARAEYPSGETFRQRLG
ncbi:LLM class flavin-dependent oxidoreductase [Microbacteriaceae bacterium VKM Ac-2854]|nr:LLM class flavin-dependent oxidoreductase [Microbacteriaceae bacterium VKM Ac-2854]